MFSKTLQQLRKSKKLTQDELANRLNINRGTYANYERGHRQPDFDTLIKIADYFDVSTDYLLGRDTKNQQTEQVSLFPFDKIGVDQDEYNNLSSYQQEVLDWAINEDALFFKNKSDNVLDMLERLEIAYEVDKVMKKREKR
ncbi:helix-turn-helix domain-containing protein [Planococcus sp. ANT_H30]|uniref:helix-turn-helix domain-containing protein n=1 Tax=Planococcus sp. ANT_H30 TaxID=2597347 RepID=UPI0011EED2AE|nr:helix-turn-helix transcriptional regulator [Planococcus sp. ANT_H30]KAA0956673.1 helix-turn-helix domain-containing protein [Planococcus sp. ANT_H30]